MSAPTFAEHMEKLSEIVNTMEQSQLPLETALKLYEQGITVTRTLHAQLKEAELKLSELEDANVD